MPRKRSSYILVGAILITAWGCGKGAPKDPSDWKYLAPDGFDQVGQPTHGHTNYHTVTESGDEVKLEIQSSMASNPETDSAANEAKAAIHADLMGVHAKIYENHPFVFHNFDGNTWLISREISEDYTDGIRYYVVYKDGVVLTFRLTGKYQAMVKYDRAVADSLQSFKWGR